MDFQKFNPKIHDSSKVAELIINSTSYHNFSGLSLKELKNSLYSKITKNKFFFENIYLLVEDNHYWGVIIFSYNKKSNSLIKLAKLLVNLKINEFIEKLYLIFLNNNIEIKNDDVYLDLIYIESKFRNDGKGTFLLNKLIQLIKHENKKQIVLHVSSNNLVARNFYEKLGFEYNVRYKNIGDNNFLAMTYNLNLNLNEKRI